MILTVNIGGIKTILSLFNKSHELKISEYAEYINVEFCTLEAIVNDFLMKIKIKPESAVFVTSNWLLNGVAKSLQTMCRIGEGQLSQLTGIQRLKVVSDITANAYTIPYLTNHEKIKIKRGRKEKHTEKYLFIDVGVNLAQVSLFCEGNKKIVTQLGGEHSDFTPTNELENNLYTYLKSGKVSASYEQIISTAGLNNIFNFLVDCGYGVFNDETFERMLVEEKSEVIIDMALKRKDTLCQKTLEIFISVLGSYAGTFATQLFTTGGVYLGGKIPLKILPLLKKDTFSQSFIHYESLSRIAEAIPVYVICQNNTANIGAAHLALDLI